MMVRPARAIVTLKVVRPVSASASCVKRVRKPLTRLAVNRGVSPSRNADACAAYGPLY